MFFKEFKMVKELSFFKENLDENLKKAENQK